MEIVVCVKQVFETRVPVQVIEGLSRTVQWLPEPVCILNPSDRAALEEALFLRDVYGGRVTAITVGESKAEAVLRTCLARGVDRAIHVVENNVELLCPSVVAFALSKAIRMLAGEIIVSGSQSLDKGSGQVPAMLAEFLDLPQITNVVRMFYDPSNGQFTAEKKLERGNRQEIEVKLPAVFGVETAISQQQYISTHAKILASNKKVENHSLVSLGIDPGWISHMSSQIRVKSIARPKPRTKKIFVPTRDLSPEERIRALMSGGRSTEAKKKEILQGNLNDVADGVINFLKKEDILSKNIY